MEHAIADPVRARSILITGAGGQLGTALRDVFPEADARRHDVTERIEARPELVLHAAAWTDVDGAETDPERARLVNVEGTRNVVALGAPVVYFSTDYVFDGKKRSPYVESDEPHPLSVYGQTKLAGEQEISQGWIVRSSWLFGSTGKNFVRTMLDLGIRQDEVRVVDDQRGSPTFVGHLAEATRDVVGLPHGTYHVTSEGDCTWAEFAEAIFALARIECRVAPISSAKLARPARRPDFSVLRSEHPETPHLPHWREGLRDCLERLGALP